MGPIAKWLVIDLLEHSDPQHFLLVKDGVTVKGNRARNGVGHVGRIILIRKEQTECEVVEDEDDTKDSAPSLNLLFAEEMTGNEFPTPSKRQESGEYFLVWAPYSFFEFCTHNALRPRPDVSPGATASTVESLEWRYIMCVAVKNIAKIRRCSLPDGTRVIELFFLDGTTGHPLIFLNGGVTKFLDALRGIAPLRQSSVTADEFLLYANDDAELGANDSYRSVSRARSSGGGLNSEKRASFDGQERGGFYSVPAFLEGLTQPDDMEQMLYERRDLSRIPRLFATLATKIGEVRLRRSRHLIQNYGKSMSTYPVSSSPTHTEDSRTEEPFEFVEELIPVECQTPQIPEPRNRTMGPPLTAEMWNSCFIGEERRIDRNRYAKAMAIAHAGGIERDIRLQVWCFALHVYPDVLESTEAQRQSVRDVYKSMYERLKEQWKGIFPEQECHFSAFREMRTSIEKDVIRTDRSHEAYVDADGVKQRMLYNVLMTHGMLNFDLGYCQGMSDVLSPIAILAETEEEAFMCFSRFLSERCEGNFRKDVKVGMKQQLEMLQVLVRFFIPRLYNHLVRQCAEEMSFCFRWLLMFFKREFSIDDTMLLWDVILTCPYTPQFELFVTAALLKALSPQILEQHLTHDELLKFTNGIAGKLDVRHVILLAQDFYDGVAKCAMAMERKEAAVGNNHRPAISEIFSLLTLAELEDSHAVSRFGF
ncbi:hypothetical protein C3747_83g53 [Trypanosoma cruzi]|uniref:Rab-GAP TBC domain-containing protein n=1 Tax=Trypanosoma cruzi TaxID=5693 RepID=A0A2V2WRA9_TRYCR|nr:hypothetical protein C3747_83g53 [Trypanosoma cruzi]RNC49642.1 GTPase activating protein [Trypanosoma cruzi]